MKKLDGEIPKKRGASCVVIIVIILAILVIVAAFIGTFAFSFVKSKVMNQTSNSLAALQKFAGGKLGNLPTGLTVKTKEEGIATCKKSGMEQCFSLVAVSFKDLGVCKQAPDVSACEAEAKKIMQDFEDSQKTEDVKADGETTVTGSSDEENKELKECKKGTYYQSLEGKIAIVGKEKITIDGSQYEVCCWEATGNQLTGESLQAMKNCSITDQPGSMFIFNKIDNRYILQGAILVKDGKQCTYSFDDNGNLEDKLCQ